MINVNKLNVLIFIWHFTKVMHISEFTQHVPNATVPPSSCLFPASCSCRSSYTFAHLSRDTTAKVRSNLPIYSTLIHTYPLKIYHRSAVCVFVLVNENTSIVLSVEFMVFFCDIGGIIIELIGANGQPSADSLIDLLRMAEGYRHI